ncbi:Protein unc-93 A, partial [Saguinus oedipus]
VDFPGPRRQLQLEPGRPGSVRDVALLPPPQSYVTCALGIQFVGYVMICFSATDALCSVLYGKVSQYTGRVALYVLGR